MRRSEKGYCAHFFFFFFFFSSGVCAIKNGKSIETSMGVTPLDGLMMGSRSGSIDPSILLLDMEEDTDWEDVLNHSSGLKAICGKNDMREITEDRKDGDEKADLAIKMFCFRITKYIGSYFAILGESNMNPKSFDVTLLRRC